MPRSMYARLLTIFLSIMLVAMLLVGALLYFTVRTDRVNGRMAELRSEAREIAYLASMLDSDSVSRKLGLSSRLERYMQWKAQNVYDEFKAYIIVVDRQGNVRSNLYTSLKDDPRLTDSINQRDVTLYLLRVLSGEEIQLQTTTDEGPVFTVGVPWVQDGSVLGAVFMHTAAQNIQAAYSEVAQQVMIATLLAAALTAVFVLIFARQVTRPIAAMARAATDMAQGHFEQRAPMSGTREVAELAESFNTMAARLQDTEQSRREFVANVSHELRSPITSIQGYVQGLLDGTIPRDEQEKYMQIVVDETRRLNRLIANLLNLSRIEQDRVALAVSDFDLNELVRRALIRKEAQIDEKGLDIEVDFGRDPCVVSADPEQIEQVVQNLMDNAVKFVHPGGKVSLSTRVSGKQAVLRVADNGPGVPPEDRPHIFERFYKADKAHTVGNGTGLGLAICQRIMDKHGQSIRLLPSEQGAVFEITLAAGAAALPGGRDGADTGAG